MSLVNDLLQKAPNLSTASKYTAVTGACYFMAGALLIAWPRATQTVFRDAAFVGSEGALIRALGLTVLVIGWFYFFGGRSGARQFVAASVIERLLFVPAVLVPLAVSGVFPHLMWTFAILDPSLAILAWILLNRRSNRSAQPVFEPSILRDDG
jgi:hypothetical protein